MIAMKKLERVASEGKFLLSHRIIRIAFLALYTAPQALCTALPVLLLVVRPKAAGARNVE